MRLWCIAAWHQDSQRSTRGLVRVGVWRSASCPALFPPRSTGSTGATRKRGRAGRGHPYARVRVGCLVRPRERERDAHASGRYLPSQIEFQGPRVPAPPRLNKLKMPAIHLYIRTCGAQVAYGPSLRHPSRHVTRDACARERRGHTPAPRADSPPDKAGEEGRGGMDAQQQGRSSAP